MRVLLPPPEPAPTPRILARAACVVLPATWPWTATENRTCRRTMSHQAALRAGLRAGSRAMVVMEDDLEWRSRGWSVSTALDAAINVTTGGGADIVFLGGLPVVPFGPEVSAGVRGPAAMMWTTCYVVSANAAREIVSWSYRGVHYDWELCCG